MPAVKKAYQRQAYLAQKVYRHAWYEYRMHVEQYGRDSAVAASLLTVVMRAVEHMTVVTDRLAGYPEDEINAAAPSVTLAVGR
jgi:hypothetical protein